MCAIISTITSVQRFFTVAQVILAFSSLLFIPMILDRRLTKKEQRCWDTCWFGRLDRKIIRGVTLKADSYRKIDFEDDVMVGDVD